MHETHLLLRSWSGPDATPVRWYTYLPSDRCLITTRPIYTRYRWRAFPAI